MHYMTYQRSNLEPLPSWVARGVRWVLRGCSRNKRGEAGVELCPLKEKTD